MCELFAEMQGFYILLGLMNLRKSTIGGYTMEKTSQHQEKNINQQGANDHETF